MKKHWTSFLPEAGRITKSGEEQVWLKMKILEKQKELDSLKMEYDKNEQDIYDTVKKDWTLEEIDEAKAASIILQRTSEEQEIVDNYFKMNEKLSKNEKLHDK